MTNKIDLGAINYGDELTVRLRFEGWDNSERLSMYLAETTRERRSGKRIGYFDPASIIEHHPTPRVFKVGDVVQKGVYEYTIIAIDGENVWVRSEQYAAGFVTRLDALR